MKISSYCHHIVTVTLVLMATSACYRMDEMTLDLEIYYYVFSGLVETEPSRNALLRVDIESCSGLKNGDSVVVELLEEDEHLRLKSVGKMGASSGDTSGYYINGVFETQDNETGEGLIGFRFSVTPSEYDATAMEANTTKIVRSFFTADGHRLLFKRLEIIDEISRKPIMWK